MQIVDIISLADTGTAQAQTARAPTFSGCAGAANCGLSVPDWPVIQLSINLNKIALIRNARDTRHPDPCEFATEVIRAGAHG